MSTMYYNRISPASSKSPSLLQPQSEQPIADIHATERSGNMIEDDEMIASRQRYLSCHYCSMRFISKSGKTNHEKAHRREEKRNERLEISKRQRLSVSRSYTCRECDEEFSTRKLLNDHKKTHQEIIECNFCHEKFKDRMDFEYHDAINDGMHYDTLKTPVHRTRSKSRLSCHNMVIEKRPSSCKPTSSTTPVSEVGSTRSTRSTVRKRSNSITLTMSARIHSPKKSRSIQAWVESTQYQPSDEEEEIPRPGSSYPESARSLSRSRSRLSVVDATSPSPTDWSIDTTNKPVDTPNSITCSDPKCRKTFPTMNWATNHEITEHKLLPLFCCTECRKRFTTRERLDQHTFTHHHNVTMCVLCDLTQTGFAQMREHFKMHLKYSIKCEVCGKLFLDRSALKTHLEETFRHKNYVQTKGKIVMRLDRRETPNLYNDINIDTYPENINKHTFDSDFSYSKSFPANENNSNCSNFVEDIPWRL